MGIEIRIGGRRKGRRRGGSWIWLRIGIVMSMSSHDLAEKSQKTTYSYYG